MSLKPAVAVFWKKGEVTLKGDFTAEHERELEGKFKNISEKGSEVFILEFSKETKLWYLVTSEYTSTDGGLLPTEYLEKKIKKSGDGAYSPRGMMLAHEDKKVLEEIYLSNKIGGFWKNREISLSY